MKLKTTKLVIFSIILGVIYWLIESLLHVLVFNQELDLLKNFVFLEPNEFWMRSTIVVLIVYLGIYSQRMVNNLRTKERVITESISKLRNEFETSNFLKDLITHDISNILHNISMSLEMQGIIHHGEKNANSNALLNKQLSRGRTLINNIRLLSNLNLNKIEVKSVDLIDIINKVIEDIRSRYQDEDITIDLLYLDLGYRVQAGDLLFNAFENILANGVIHNHNQAKKLWVELSKTKIEDIGCIKIQFKDNGHGISEDMKKVIFTRKVKKSSKGMGIGLSLVKKIIDTYDGEIKVENRVIGDESKGSNFIVLLKECA